MKRSTESSLAAQGMREGPSEPVGRTGSKPPRAAPVKSRGGERRWKRRGQTASGEIQGDERLNCRERVESVWMMSKPGRAVNPGQGQRESAAWLVGIRHRGGVNLNQVLVRNVGTCRLDAKGEIQVAAPRG